MKLAKIVLSVGIAIVFAVFVGYGLYTFYEPPKYSQEINNCYQTVNCERFFQSCRTNVGDEKLDYRKEQFCSDAVYSSPEYQMCQDAQEKCNADFTKSTARYAYYRNSFYILIFIGLLAIIGGILISRLDSIGSGFIGGGVMVVLWSLAYTANYWLTLNKYVRLLALGVVLAVLIYLGYKRIEEKIKNKDA
jgi:hypothetical protein